MGSEIKPANYGTYIFSWKEKVVALLISVIGTLGVSWLFYDSLLGLVLMPMFYAVIRKKMMSYLKKKRNQQIRSEFKDCLYSFSSSFSAGRGLEEAIEEAEKSLRRIYQHSLLAEEFSEILKQCTYADGSVLQLWDQLSRRISLEEMQQFTDVIWACRRSGGNLVTAVDRCANILTEKILVEGEINKLMSQKKYEGQMILMMPALLLLALKLSSPMYLSVMYQTAIGRILMTVALVIIIGSYIVLERMMNVQI